MAKDKKGNLFYEVTREKPVGKLQILLMGGSVGTVVSLFIVAVVGSFYGTGMDDLVFFFILSGIFGFFVGGFLIWFFIHSFSKAVAVSFGEPKKKNEEKIENQPAAANSEPVVLAEDAAKGQSVDYVFPEISPDK
jgi:hypothetical protein